MGTRDSYNGSFASDEGRCLSESEGGRVPTLYFARINKSEDELG